MKKLIVFIAMIFISAGIMATNTENSNYVVANGQTHFGKDIKFGMRYTKVIKTTGEVVKIRNAEVDAICNNGKVFEKMPVVRCDTKEKEMVMLEYVTSRNGLKLYRLCQFVEKCDPGTQTFRTAQPEYCYYVFKDGAFYLQIDKKNAATALPFFGLGVES